MKLLVVSACSGRKRHDPVVGCAEIDEADRATLIDRYPEATAPAAAQYTGREHGHVGDGVRQLRENTDASVDWSLVSAGFGVLDESTPIPAYDCTFGDRDAVRDRLRASGHDPETLTNRQEIRTLGRELDVPSDLERRLDDGYDLVFVVLGATYLQAVASALEGLPQTVDAVAFAAAGANDEIGACVWVPATETERAALETSWIELRGRLFEAFAADATDETLRRVAGDPRRVPEEIEAI